MNPEDQDNKNNMPMQDGSEGGDGQQMPPGDNQPMQSPMVGSPQKSKKMWWVWLLILLLIFLLLFFGWWWWKDKDKTDQTAQNNGGSTQQEEQVEEAACDEGFTAYENAEQGIGFCYPTDWGTVTLADAKFAAADTGERWTFRFADKAMVNLGVVTADWSTEVARDGTCVDPAVQTLPAFSPFSTTWTTEGTPVMSATRGVEVMSGQYLIRETVDDLLTNGVCLEGYTLIEGDVYTHTAASYSAEFAAPVTTPQQHIDNPNTLIPATDRNQFYTFVKSVHAL
ncbi:MAG: hypothetical protein ACREGD_03330 [Candidatus Saccharimonadales bacterium]